MTISAIVITRNEEDHIGACLESLAWADERVVLDSLSTDRTAEIARAATSQVQQRPFDTFPRQRNAALDLATGEWAFFLDADERATPELAGEVRLAVEDPQYAGYWAPRRNIILGKWMQHTGWWPDYQLKLFRRDRGRFDEDKLVHEVPAIEGQCGYLRNPITHYNYQRLGEFFSRQDFYSTFEARAMLQRGVRARPRNLVLQPYREFVRRYVEWQGYKDGFHGLFLSLAMAWFNFITYCKLARLGRETLPS
ncbi:MAG: glycosyltransferase family 2 protein [Dehalococcoidia bacterium]|nr:glycosyltransferase family 2 protein [Dehalococcoidia bacterium]